MNMSKNATAKKLKSCVKRHLKAKGHMVYKTLIGGFIKERNYKTSPGWPDLMVFSGNGKCIFIECKNETGKLRDTKIIRFHDLQRLGHTIYIARPKEVEPLFKLEKLADITYEEYMAAKERTTNWRQQKGRVIEGE
jgi:hypothetical protein